MCKWERRGKESKSGAGQRNERGTSAGQEESAKFPEPAAKAQPMGEPRDWGQGGRGNAAIGPR